MLSSWLSDIWPISCATRWEMGAVEVTHGHDVPAAACPAALVLVDWAVATGPAISPARATVTATATIRRWRYLPQLTTRRTSAPIIGHLPRGRARLPSARNS